MAVGSTHRTNGGRTNVATRRKTALVVEPEALLRWSVAKYLGRWFKVFAVDSAQEAAKVLDDTAVDAAVVSEDLPDRAIETIEGRLRRQKSPARVVRTATAMGNAGARSPAVLFLEKPFQLQALLRLLREPLGDAAQTHGGCVRH